jgi:hypothetical protein
MPGPGVELIGEEEIAEVMQVLTSRALSRYGSADDPNFAAKVRTVEREIAAIAGVRYGLGLHGGGSSGLFITLLGIGVGSTPGGSRSSPRSTTRSTSIRPTWRRGSRPGPGRSSSSTCSVRRRGSTS